MNMVDSNLWSHWFTTLCLLVNNTYPYQKIIMDIFLLAYCNCLLKLLILLWMSTALNVYCLLKLPTETTLLYSYFELIIFFKLCSFSLLLLYPLLSTASLYSLYSTTLSTLLLFSLLSLLYYYTRLVIYWLTITCWSYTDSLLAGLLLLL